MEYDTITRIRRVVAVNEWEEAFPWGVYQNHESVVHSTSDLDPSATSVEADYNIIVQLPERSVEIQSVFHFSSDRDSLYYDYTRTIRENEKLLRTARWDERIPRDHQ
jgi:hypothetical protein